MNAAPATFASNPRLIERAAILQGLSDPDAEKRLEAAKRLDLLDLGSGEFVAHLIPCLRDADAKVRAHAAVKLGMMRVAAMDAVPVLKEVAKEDSDENVRSHAKDALYNIRGYDYSPISIQLE
jgi:HEAT repeat protein